MHFTKIFIALPLLLMLTATTAQACQLVCVTTTTSYDGNLGGLTGADAKCASEFGTGWKFARSTSILSSLAGSAGNILSILVGGNYARAASWPVIAGCQSGGTPYNCTNWTTNDAGTSACVVGVGGGSPAYYAAPTLSGNTCASKVPLICCNM